MSIKVMASVWEHSQQRGTALLMLLAIADNANEYGEAWPSVPKLAEKCRMKVRNAQVLLRELEASGELRIETQGGRNTPNGATNMYCVMTPGAMDRPGVQHSAPVQDTAPVGVQNSVARGAKFGTEGVQHSAPKPSVNRQNLKDAAAVDSTADKPRSESNGISAPKTVVGALIDLTLTRGQAIQYAKQLTLDDVAVWREWLVHHKSKDPPIGVMIDYLKEGRARPPVLERAIGTSAHEIPLDEHGNIHPSYFRSRQQ